ncbi:hypothetical protein AAC387_Pa07g2550 [Persea americana]
MQAIQDAQLPPRISSGIFIFFATSGTVLLTKLRSDHRHIPGLKWQKVKYGHKTPTNNIGARNDEESSRSRWIGLGLDAKGWALAVDDASAGLEGVTGEGDDRR